MQLNGLMLTINVLFRPDTAEFRINQALYPLKRMAI